MIPNRKKNNECLYKFSVFYVQNNIIDTYKDVESIITTKSFVYSADVEEEELDRR